VLAASDGLQYFYESERLGPGVQALTDGAPLGKYFLHLKVWLFVFADFTRETRRQKTKKLQIFMDSSG
jgi:hypothetical protein